MRPAIIRTTRQDKQKNQITNIYIQNSNFSLEKKLHNNKVEIGSNKTLSYQTSFLSNRKKNLGPFLDETWKQTKKTQIIKTLIL